jgi:hypothetical protein
MCDFVSTCELDEEELESILTVEKGDKVLFLTHDDVYKSPKGKKIFGTIPQENLKGHSAVRRFFELKGNVGSEREYNDLSDPESLPPALVRAIRAGKFVGIGYSTQLLSSDGIEKFEKAKEKVIKSKSEKPYGDFYEITKAFWSVFTAAKANRAEAWV